MKTHGMEFRSASTINATLAEINCSKMDYKQIRVALIVLQVLVVSHMFAQQTGKQVFVPASPEDAKVKDWRNGDDLTVSTQWTYFIDDLGNGEFEIRIRRKDGAPSEIEGKITLTNKESVLEGVYEFGSEYLVAYYDQNKAIDGVSYHLKRYDKATLIEAGGQVDLELPILPPAHRSIIPHGISFRRSSDGSKAMFYHYRTYWDRVQILNCWVFDKTLALLSSYQKKVPVAADPVNDCEAFLKNDGTAYVILRGTPLDELNSHMKDGEMAVSVLPATTKPYKTNKPVCIEIKGNSARIWNGQLASGTSFARHAFGIHNEKLYFCGLSSTEGDDNKMIGWTFGHLDDQFNPVELAHGDVQWLGPNSFLLGERFGHFIETQDGGVAVCIGDYALSDVFKFASNGELVWTNSLRLSCPSKMFSVWNDQPFLLFLGKQGDAEKLMAGKFVNARIDTGLPIMVSWDAAGSVTARYLLEGEYSTIQASRLTYPAPDATTGGRCIEVMSEKEPFKGVLKVALE